MSRGDTVSYRPRRGRRLLRRLVVLAGLGALAAAVARRRSPTPDVHPTSPSAAPPPGPEAQPAPAPEPEPSSARSREELYREARALGVKGRSKMTKAELEQALAEHRR